MSLKKVLLLGLNRSDARALRQAAADERCEVVEASFASDERLAELARGESALAFVPADPALQRSILDRLTAARSRVPFIVVGESAGPAEWLNAVRLGARDYLEPPLGIEEVRSALRRAWRSEPMSRYVSVVAA